MSSRTTTKLISYIIVYKSSYDKFMYSYKLIAILAILASMFVSILVESRSARAVESSTLDIEIIYTLGFQKMRSCTVICRSKTIENDRCT